MLIFQKYSSLISFAENRTLKRRLAKKGRQIGRMLTGTQRLAERLGQKQGVSQAEDNSLIKID